MVSLLPVLKGPSVVGGCYFPEVTEAKTWECCYLSVFCLYCPNHRSMLGHGRDLPQQQPDLELPSNLLTLPPWQWLAFSSLFLLPRPGPVHKDQKQKEEAAGCVSVIKSSPSDRQCQDDDTLPREKGKERSFLQQFSLSCKAALIKIGLQEPSATVLQAQPSEIRH